MGRVSKECSTCNTAPRIDRNCFINPLFNVDIDMNGVRYVLGRVDRKRMEYNRVEKGK